MYSFLERNNTLEFIWNIADIENTSLDFNSFLNYFSVTKFIVQQESKKKSITFKEDLIL